MSWRSKINDTLTNLMPFAFMVDGKRIVPDEEEFRLAVGSVNEQVMGLIELTYKHGFKQALTEKIDPGQALALADFYSNRAFLEYRMNNDLDRDCPVIKVGY